ncbi:MAG: hypothetical protein ACI87W_000881 [Halieaceae bacterium]|jgi:hypothetical protein
MVADDQHAARNVAGIAKTESCATCGRAVPLGFHHLIPRKLHRRNYFRKHFDREVLNRGIRICRECHNGIHRRYDEMILGKEFASLQALLADEALLRHFAWVARQRR